MYRGDLLFLTYHRDDPIRAGEIVVFSIEGRQIPIVHRTLNIHEGCVTKTKQHLINLTSTCCRNNGTMKILTKGDNNRVDDRGLYAEGQMFIEPKEVIGRARIIVPYLGIFTIIMNDYPMVKVR